MKISILRAYLLVIASLVTTLPARASESREGVAVNRLVRSLNNNITSTCTAAGAALLGESGGAHSEVRKELDSLQGKISQAQKDNVERLFNNFANELSSGYFLSACKNIFEESMREIYQKEMTPAEMDVVSDFYESQAGFKFSLYGPAMVVIKDKIDLHKIFSQEEVEDILFFFSNRVGKKFLSVTQSNMGLLEPKVLSFIREIEAKVYEKRKAIFKSELGVSI